jgi:curli biogenesis system outer membrane secretion channel CsgG
MKRHIYITIVGLPALAACSASTPSPIIEERPRELHPRLCAAPGPGTYGVVPLENKTRRELVLDGTDDLLTTAMSDSGCFTLIERDKLSLLIEEMRLCEETNPDREFLKCDSFAKKGNLLGLSDLLVGDVIYYEPNASGSAISVAVPWIGSVSLDQNYAALAVSLRLLRVEDATVRTSTNVSALVPSSNAGVSADTPRFDFGATAHSSTPLGKALQDMIDEGVRRIQAGLGETT